MSIARRAALGALFCGFLAASAACTPLQIDQFKALAPDQQAAVVDALREREPAHSPPGGFLACVRRHESGGDYRAQNPSSSASGAYQYIRSTWVVVSARAGHGGYPTASSAPPHVQDAVAQWTVANVGKSPWAGTGC